MKNNIQFIHLKLKDEWMWLYCNVVLRKQFHILYQLKLEKLMNV